MIPEDIPQIRFPGMSELETIEAIESMGQGHFLTIGPDKRSSNKWKKFLGVAFFLRIEMIKDKHCS
jgi:hypothetical protein